MIPRKLLGTARIPGGSEMKLYARGADHMILVDREELMSSRMSGSEEALALLTAQRLGVRSAQHRLIGGYGMGFTLRAALAALQLDAHLTPAELVPERLSWANGPLTTSPAHGPRAAGTSLGGVGKAGRRELPDMNTRIGIRSPALMADRPVVWTSADQITIR